MKFWHRTTITEDSKGGKEYICAECQDAVIPITRPTVIFLSGVLAADDNEIKKGSLAEKYFNQVAQYWNFDSIHAKPLEWFNKGNFNYVDKLLSFNYRQNIARDLLKYKGNHVRKENPSELNEAIKIYSVSYNSTEELIKDHEATLVAPNTFFGLEAAEVVKRLFLPALAIETSCEKKNGQWKVKGKKREIEEIRTYLNNITFTGNSYGSNFLIQIENALQHFMKELDFSEKEQIAVMDSVCAVIVSNISPFKAVSGPRFTSIFVEGINDRVAEIFNKKYKTEPPDSSYYYPPVIKEKDSPSPDTTKPYFDIQKCADNRLLVLSDVNRRVHRWKERSGYFDYEWIDNDYTGHHLAHYTMRGEPYSVLPDLVERMLRNAVMRKEKPIHKMQDFFGQASLWPQKHGAALSMDRIREGRLSSLIRKQFERIYPSILEGISR